MRKITEFSIRWFSILMLMVVAVSALVITSFVPVSSPSSSSTALPTVSEMDSTTVIPTPVTTPEPSSRSDGVTQQDLLGVYNDLVGTLHFALVIASVVMALLAVAGVWSTVRVEKIHESIKLATTQIEDLTSKVKALEEKIHKEMKLAITQIEGLTSNVKALEEKRQNIQAQLDKQRGVINGDIEILEQLYSLAQVDRYSMRLFGDNLGRREGAKKELWQLSRNTNPVVRRECLRTFAAMPDYLDNDWYDERIFERINEMEEKDGERGVRIEAQETKKKWEELLKAGP